nr:CPBP family intramembrane glutamic endopeptidase [Synechocystis sp. PCC 7509]
MGVTAVLLGLLAKLWLKFGDVALLPWCWDVTTLPLAMAIAAIVTTISSLMYQFWASYRHSADFYLEFVLKPLALPDLIWVGLLPGLSEELLFRGVMLPAFGLDTTGIAVSSACFGILHLSNCKQWQYVVWATIVGFILGYTAVATHNLLIPIIAHVLINLISSSVWKLKHPESQA